MICSNLLSSLGLAMDIAGAVMLYRYGAPMRHETKDGSIYIPFHHSDDKKTEELKKKYAKEERLSKTGIWLLGIGFAAQLASNLLT